ncbi:MAG: response regulator [Lachnospiraceae bacterium]|nr:response regulator [Lachnospiraceae bacterium]
MEKMRILVVDDNTVNLATVEQELKEKYEVIPMLSGRRAVKYLYREKVDLILLDVQMPIMDGIETLKTIRTQENGVTVPVIFLTTKKDKLTVVEGAKLGIMDYITKPVDSDELHERIEKVFKRLGMLPMEEEELYGRLQDILSDIQKEHFKQAIFKTDEVLGYQIQDDVSGRMRNAKQKLADGDYEAAENMVARVIRMMEKNVYTLNKSAALPIGVGEINARVLYILDDLENFKIKNAIMKIKDLKKFDLPPFVANALEKVLEKLKDYDDEEAENLLQDLIEEMKKPKMFKK